MLKIQEKRRSWKGWDDGPMPFPGKQENKNSKNARNSYSVIHQIKRPCLNVLSLPLRLELYQLGVHILAN